MTRSRLVCFARLAWQTSLLLGVLTAGVAWAPASNAQPTAPRVAQPRIDVSRNRVFLDARIWLDFPKTWTAAADKYSNAVELVAKGAAGTDFAPEARSIITVEPRVSQDEAVGRLAQIARSHAGKAIYLSIGGWPAVVSRYREKLPPQTERPGLTNEPDMAQVDEIADQPVEHTTTAIAVESSVVRTDTTLAPKASHALAIEAETMARKATLPKRPDPGSTLEELKRLKTGKPSADGTNQPAPIEGIPARRPTRLVGIGSTAPAALVGGFSETEAGVANGGQNLIVASNGGTSISSNSGTTFAATAALPPFPTQGDPSIAIGASGNFYQANLGLPGAVSTGNTTGLTGCSASVMASGNNGAVFSFAGHAALCPATGTSMCFPDQEHIAADRFNTSPGHGDQLYAVWRNQGAFNVVGAGLPSNCNGISLGNFTPSLSCSTNSGSTWTAARAIGSGDFPRISVGPDGSVYVVMRDGGDVVIHKYTSCSNGLLELAGFPRQIMSGINDTTCPLPGLDRCHNGLIVPTVAVDDTNPAHLYVAVEKSASGSAQNDDIIVADSSDGGLTWSTPLAVNGAVSARRFMPWLCVSAGQAYVGWYDRRAASKPGAATNDLTDFFLGSARTRNGQLVSDGERNLTGTADAQCASGWGGSAPRSSDDSEKCTTQPQLAGRCQNGSGGGSNALCDFSSGPACPSGESCKTGPGSPKYGDYNGIACGPDRVLSTWASATPPLGFGGSAPGGIVAFSDVEIVNGGLTVHERSIPAGDPAKFIVAIDGAPISGALSNSSAGPVSLQVATPHVLSQSAAPGTSLSNYASSIDGDCDTNGAIHFSALHAATCRITNVNRAYDTCIQSCNVAEGACMSGAHSTVERQQCIGEKLACTDGCSSATLTVTKHLVPGVDAGRFNLMVDGTSRQSAVGDGGTTDEITLAVGAHVVGESAVSGTSLANYVTAISGDCDAAGNIALIPGSHMTCSITNARKPGTGADATLTVTTSVSPATDPGRFDLSIDGTVRATNVGNGGASGPVVVMEGAHSVSEAGHGTNLSNYIRTIGGDCDASGAIVLAAGANKTCSIANRKDTGPCEAACNVVEGQCMAGAHTSSQRQECIADKKACVQQCQ